MKDIKRGQECEWSLEGIENKKDNCCTILS